MIDSIALLAAGAFSSYHVVSTTVTSPHPSLERVAYEVQVGPSPLNRFEITHIHKKCAHDEGSLILLSPFLLPGAFYEISETGHYLKSAAGRLANSDVDLWLVDQRQTHLTAGACESGAADCSVMASWNFDTYSSDALFALSLLRAQKPREKPVIGGFSAGSNTTLATIDRAPREFKGAFLYEGTFFTEDPTIQAHNDAICDELEAKLSSGVYYDATAAIPGLVLRLAAADRDALSPIPGFPPGTTNQLAELFVFGSPPPPGAISPTPGFTRCLADFTTQSYVYTNQTRLELAGPLFDSYASVAALRDLACGLAGRDDSHYDNADAFRGKVEIFVEGSGFGPAMFDTASLFDSASAVAIDSNPEFGEADPYFHRDWEKYFYRPLRKWLHSVF
jgi:hypothetical protein